MALKGAFFPENCERNIGFTWQFAAFIDYYWPILQELFFFLMPKGLLFLIGH